MTAPPASVSERLGLASRNPCPAIALKAARVLTQQVALQIGATIAVRDVRTLAVRTIDPPRSGPEKLGLAAHGQGLLARKEVAADERSAGS